MIAEYRMSRDKTIVLGEQIVVSCHGRCSRFLAFLKGNGYDMP